MTVFLLSYYGKFSASSSRTERKIHEQTSLSCVILPHRRETFNQYTIFYRRILKQHMNFPLGHSSFVTHTKNRKTLGVTK